MHGPIIVYIGAATTNASVAFKSRLSLFKQKLRDLGNAIILEWIASEQADSSTMYERDIANIRGCHLFVALLDEPSIGLGMEIAEAMRERKAVLALHPRKVTPSRLLQSAAQSGLVELRTYRNTEEALQISCEFIERHATRYASTTFI